MTDSDLDQGDEALLTYCDDVAGERTTLTAADLGDWAAATAALLTEDCGLRPRRPPARARGGLCPAPRHPRRWAPPAALANRRRASRRLGGRCRSVLPEQC